MDVTDVSDWHLPEIRFFEGHLRCPICRDFFNVPVTLRTCRHTFCSLCIRQHFALVSECPCCRMSYGESFELEPNHTVDEIVDSFKTIRGSLLKALNGAKGDGEICPLCDGFFPKREIERHAEGCVGEGDAASRRHDGARRPPPRQPLPKPVFSLMKDVQLRRALADHGLPSNGDRQMLIRRLADFINLYNVECDSRRPKGLERIRSTVLENERQLIRMQQRSKNDDPEGYDTKSRAQASLLLERAKRLRVEPDGKDAEDKGATS